ncbi:MAG: hypothetical protein IT385_24790 [Deltaproteobacteria bacterium]|nr:hypothetical protein [Deltaproteobacteria bacterium]
MTRSLFASTLFALALAGGACDVINGPSELERQIAAEQEVIKAYSADVDKVDALQRAFVESWKKANEKKDLKVYKDDLAANVLPALDAYVKAAGAMPTRSPELDSIHKPLVAAYQAAQAELVRFSGAVTEDNVDAEYAKVLAAMDEVKKAEGVYLDKLKTYYAKNRVELRQAP